MEESELDEEAAADGGTRMDSWGFEGREEQANCGWAKNDSITNTQDPDEAVSCL